MAYGIAAYGPEGREIIQQYSPFNFASAIVVANSSGTQTYSVQGVPEGSDWEWVIVAGHPGGANTNISINVTSVNKSGRTITVDQTTGIGFLFRPAIIIYSKR